MENYVYLHHFKMYPVVDDRKLLGCVTVNDIKMIPREELTQTTVGDLTSPCSSDDTVSPDNDALKLIEAMTKPDTSGRYMVVENDGLVGIISLKNLRAFISLKLELESPEG